MQIRYAFCNILSQLVYIENYTQSRIVRILPFRYWNILFTEIPFYFIVYSLVAILHICKIFLIALYICRFFHCSYYRSSYFAEFSRLIFAT
jgi:hypothetical protein